MRSIGKKIQLTDREVAVLCFLLNYDEAGGAVADRNTLQFFRRDYVLATARKHKGVLNKEGQAILAGAVRQIICE